MKSMNISNLPRAFLYHLMCLANSKTSQASYVKSKALFLCRENLDFDLIEIDRKIMMLILVYFMLSIVYIMYIIINIKE